MTGRCAQTDRNTHTHTSNEHIIFAIHFVHLAEIINDEEHIRNDKSWHWDGVCLFSKKFCALHGHFSA